MKMEWLISGTEPELIKESYLTGGFIYENYIRDALGKMYELEITYLYRGRSKSRIIRIIQFIRYIIKNLFIRFKGEIVIRDMFSTVAAPFAKNRKNVAILHHLDISNVGYKNLYRIIKKRFYKRICLADKVIVVSEYWKDILEKYGCSDVSVIYNSFDLSLFKFDSQELIDFQKKLGIDKRKPIIYLGNARPEKGYLESYEALKDVDAVFVTTGRGMIDLPISQFYLSYSDYLKLLKISTLTITMSKFNEGWCRTAHESMLCETAVIGSGRGGMRELLEKGGQIVCEDFNTLKSVVVDLLSDKDRLKSIALKGKKYTEQFTLDYFGKSWIDLMSSL